MQYVLRVAGALAAIALVGGVVYFGPAAAARLAGPSTPEAAAPAPTSAPEPLVAGVIVDPSGSNGGERSAHGDLEELADTVSRWAGPQPVADSPAVTPARPGLDLTVRQVARNSYGADAQVAHILIDSLPELKGAPDGSDMDAAIAYAEESETYLKAWKKVRAQAEKGAQQLRAATLRNEDSEIAGALSAMAQMLPGSDQTRPIIVISDVEQAGADPQVDGNLAGTEITVYHRCDSGAARCQDARDSFTRLAKRMGGPKPNFVRIETLPATLSQTLGG